MSQLVGQAALAGPTFSFPLARLLDPGRYTRPVLWSLGLGLVAGWWSTWFFRVPVWMATFVVLLVLLPVGVLKWRVDYQRYGATVMLLSIVLTTQGLHTIEHLVQWAQYHLLYWPMRQSSGLLSPANAEWVHFVWNWLILLVVVALIMGGMRNFWAYVLLAVTVAHAVEHTYLFVRYLAVLGELRALGIDNVTAQGLAGIVGRDGWLARCSIDQLAFFRQIPGLTTAIRLDVHFWWNAIEMVCLLAAGHLFLVQRWRTEEK
ncbi:MAG: hypothetical protein KF832_06585 [Caldilineaceae bacterium]|nr:hypothetical protein [Caldilineaceae bacterium]